MNHISSYWLASNLFLWRTSIPIFMKTYQFNKKFKSSKKLVSHLSKSFYRFTFFSVLLFTYSIPPFFINISDFSPKQVIKIHFRPLKIGGGESELCCTLCDIVSAILLHYQIVTDSFKLYYTERFFLAMWEFYFCSHRHTRKINYLNRVVNGKNFLKVAFIVFYEG